MTNRLALLALLLASVVAGAQQTKTDADQWDGTCNANPLSDQGCIVIPDYGTTNIGDTINIVGSTPNPYTVEILSWTEGQNPFLIVVRERGDMILAVRMDGTIAYHSVRLNKSARIFWQAMGREFSRQFIADVKQQQRARHHRRHK